MSFRALGETPKLKINFITSLHYFQLLIVNKMNFNTIDLLFNPSTGQLILRIFLDIQCFMATNKSLQFLSDFQKSQKII